MRDMGVLGLLICCAGYRCSHSEAISGDRKMCGYPISSRGLSARPAASAAPTRGIWQGVERGSEVLVTIR
jgi:hypothetical protein